MKKTVYEAPIVVMATLEKADIMLISGDPDQGEWDEL